MGDVDGAIGQHRPDRRALFELASEHSGYFTAAQARSCGYSPALLAYHAQTGALQRIRTGLYRFRDYPTMPNDEVVAAWLAVGQDSAVVSHESALDLWSLSDLIPDAIHLTVPRFRRHLPRLPGVTIHTTSRSLDPPNVREWAGVRLTAPGRTLLDVAEAGSAPDQVELAVHQALRRGWIDRAALRAEAEQRGRRVGQLIGQALSSGPSAPGGAE